jgi:hypothetical protein
MLPPERGEHLRERIDLAFLHLSPILSVPFLADSFEVGRAHRRVRPVAVVAAAQRERHGTLRDSVQVRRVLRFRRTLPRRWRRVKRDAVRVKILLSGHLRQLPSMTFYHYHNNNPSATRTREAIMRKILTLHIWRQPKLPPIRTDNLSQRLRRRRSLTIPAPPARVRHARRRRRHTSHTTIAIPRKRRRARCRHARHRTAPVARRRRRGHHRHLRRRRRRDTALAR